MDLCQRRTVHYTQSTWHLCPWQERFAQKHWDGLAACLTQRSSFSQLLQPYLYCRLWTLLDSVIQYILVIWHSRLTSKCPPFPCTACSFACILNIWFWILVQTCNGIYRHKNIYKESTDFPLWAIFQFKEPLGRTLTSDVVVDKSVIIHSWRMLRMLVFMMAAQHYKLPVYLSSNPLIYYPLTILLLFP